MKKTQKRSLKLQLSKETLRALDVDRLGPVVGGLTKYACTTICPDTQTNDTCPGVGC